MTRYNGSFGRIFVLVVLLAGPATAQAAEQAATVHVLSVGVSEYQRLPMQAQLHYAHKDALDFAGQLRGKAGQSITLVNGQATRRAILASLEDVAGRVQAGDWVVVLLSGHGGFADLVDREWFFIPYDTDPANVRDTAVSRNALHGCLTRISQKGVHVILILDACHSGSMALGDPEYAVLAGCLAQESCMEAPDLCNGTFTRALLEALQRRVGVAHGVTLRTLQEYVGNRLRQYRSAGILRRHGIQTPVFAWPASLEGSLPLGNIALAAK
jgi:uncharacterized caspase-like protein